MFEYQFTVPMKRELLNPQIKRFVNSQEVYYEYIETKDGFSYSLEFSTDTKVNNFKRELNERFPNIYL
jgi:hypothetical protein